MKIIRRRRHTENENISNRYTVIAAVGPGETLPFAIGEQTGLDDLGAIRVDDIRLTDNPEPGLERDARVYVVEVATLETIGDVPDMP